MWKPEHRLATDLHRLHDRGDHHDGQLGHLYAALCAGRTQPAGKASVNEHRRSAIAVDTRPLLRYARPLLRDAATDRMGTKRKTCYCLTSASRTRVWREHAEHKLNRELDRASIYIVW